MPKYLIQGSYTTEGIKGLLKDGGTGRRAAVDAAAKSVGASVEALYWTFGSDDFVLIVDAKDNTTVARLSLTVGASGAVNIRTIPLLTVDELDEAVQETGEYRPPGK